MLSFLAARFLVSIHTWLIACAGGNGLSVGCVSRYSTSILVVCALSLYLPERCRFLPLMAIVACSRSISSRGMSDSSLGLHPISVKIVKIQAKDFEALSMMACTLSGVGI